MKYVLVTGGAGFIGSNFILQYMAAHPETYVVNFDVLTYAANLDHLREASESPKYTFVRGDISQREAVEAVFERYPISGVFHFAAESHVDNSITHPEAFVRTNVLGTFMLLETARRHWMPAPHEWYAGKEENRFLHVSTDEVYGSLDAQGFFSEQSPYAPNSPYSASKAGSDFLARSYFQTYGMNVVTTNCANNYGPRQHAEKLIPTIIRNALSGKNIPIYGDGQNVRDWLYVDDHVKGLILAFSRGKAGETYAIGGRNEQTNLALATTVCQLLDEIRPRSDGKSYAYQLTFVRDRAGHDQRYAIDPAKIETTLGWHAAEDFASGLRKTIAWYLKHFPIS